MHKTIKGIRICRECSGICHEGSWRTKYRIRKHYWCSETHLKRQYEHWGKDWPEFRDKYFEQVDLITS